MSHCQGCLLSDIPDGACPGCGHEDLERQLAEAKQDALRLFRENVLANEKLAEAQAEITQLKHLQITSADAAIVVGLRAERDALHAKVADLEQRFDLEVHQQVDMQTRTLRATLAQAREALRNLSFFRRGQRCWCEPGISPSSGHQGQCLAAKAALNARKEAVPTAWLCTVERPGLVCAPDKHHPDCPRVRKEVGG